VFSYSSYLEQLNVKDHLKLQGLFVSRSRKKKAGSLNPMLECELIKGLRKAQLKLIPSSKANIVLMNDPVGTRYIKAFVGYLSDLENEVTSLKSMYQALAK
jgi:hypothetical protein